MNPACVTGLGFWMPGVGGPRALATGTIDPALTEPPCALLPSRLARRTSLLTRMMVEAISQAAQAAGISIAEVPSVFATAYGETETLGALLGMLSADGDLSPTRFHNSVFNTASGYFSIAAVNKSFTTTIAAGEESVAMALLEAFALLDERGGHVLAVFGEEAPTMALQGPPFQPLAAAICLSAERPASGGFGWLSFPWRAAATALPVFPVELRHNPVASAWPLVRALQTGEAGVMSLSHADSGSWLVKLSRERAAS